MPPVTASAVLFVTGKARRSLDLRSSNVTNAPIHNLLLQILTSVARQRHCRNVKAIDESSPPSGYKSAGWL